MMGKRSPIIMMNDFVPAIVLIDCEGFENHPIVSEIRGKMEAKLASEECRYGYAMHETGHYMYFMEIGYKTFNFKPSRIIFSDGSFSGQMASLEAIRDASASLVPADVVLGFAKALAAAGEFTRFFVPGIHPGDENDRMIFDEWYEAQRKTDSVMGADAYWSQAQKAVWLRLQDPGFRAKAIQECQLVYSKLFPWVVKSSNSVA